ncbi:PRC-barrel domain-containing protein [Streptomyces virginiae]|uniref:PRC-barrel domain-containing protein n=1 Tax=Streptomyces virginiae TaxID=1961 RepID=UPI00371AD8C7
MMLFSLAKGRAVIALATAETLATVTGLAIAPTPARIAALRLKVKGTGTLVKWTDVQAFGPDAVTVRSADKIRTDSDMSVPADKHHDPIGKRVLTDTGQDVGILGDVDFDETTGHIQRLIVGSQEIAGERLLGVGTYAVVIAAP